jgi:O-antigen/teichoic acid export membrane protein
VSAFFAQTQEYVRMCFFARRRPAAAFACDLVGYGGRIVALAWLVSTEHADAANALLVVGLAFSVATMLGWALLGRPVRPTRSQMVGSLRRHWEFAKWLGPAAAMQWISRNAFTVSAGVLLGAAAAGAVRAAQNIMGFSNVAFFGLNNTVAPTAARQLAAGGSTSLARYLKGLAQVLVGATAALAVLVSWQPEFWFRLFYGTPYREFAGLLRWVAATHVVRGFLLPVSVGLRALERTRPLFQATLVSSAFTLITAEPIVSSIGVTGAVVGPFISSLIALALSARGLSVALRRPRDGAEAASA